MKHLFRKLFNGSLPGDDIRRKLIYYDYSESTLRRWIREGLLDRRGDGLVLTKKGYKYN